MYVSGLHNTNMDTKISTSTCSREMSFEMIFTLKVQCTCINSNNYRVIVNMEKNKFRELYLHNVIHVYI